MRRLVLRISDGLSKFRPQFWILDCDRLVYRWMASDIGGVVGECSQCKGVLVHVLTLEQQFAHEVSAANVMHQVAEFSAAEWVVPEILDDSAAVGVGMCFCDLVLGQPRIPL